METKHFTAAFSIKSFTETGAFAGYASVFNVVDHQNDMMLPGAFAATLATDSAAKLLWQHQPDEPIGVLHSLKEDSYGLHVSGELLLAITRGAEAYALLKSGAINGLSIGYRPKRFDYDPKTGVRYLQEVELLEVSLVTFPANEHAGVTHLKSERPNTIREFEHFLRDAGFSRAEAKSIASAGFTALHTRDAEEEALLAAIDTAALTLQSQQGTYYEHK